MSTAREELLNSAMQLSEQERVLLATDLMNSVADHLPGMSVDDPEFVEELERRSSDGSATVPWDEVKAELRTELDH